MSVRRVAALLALVALAGCAKRGLPTGGPPDLEPPRLVESEPDSGAAGVPLDVAPTLGFSEGMEPRSTGDAISLAPPVEIRRLRWSGRSVTVAFAQPLERGRTYTLFVASTARDRHGNPLERGAGVVFTTGDSFPPGRIEGTLEARGFTTGGTVLWAYDASRGREPDSTGRDFDALGLVDADGGFRIPGLPVPASYRVWAFADLNANRSFEPETDILAALDTVVALAPGRPVAAGLRFPVVNPRAPGLAKGTVLDSLAERGGSLRVIAVADSDTTQRVQAAAGDRGEWELALPAGTWRVRAYRDLDGDQDWDAEEEPASEARPVTLAPAEEVAGITLVLLPRPRGPE